MTSSICVTLPRSMIITWYHLNIGIGIHSRNRAEGSITCLCCRTSRPTVVHFTSTLPDQIFLASWLEWHQIITDPLNNVALWLWRVWFTAQAFILVLQLLKRRVTRRSIDQRLCLRQLHAFNNWAFDCWNRFLAWSFVSVLSFVRRRIDQVFCWVRLWVSFPKHWTVL